MKKQNANKLAFAKKNVTELNIEELNKIQGGTGYYNQYPTNPLGCTYCIASSNGPGTIGEYYETIILQ
ncbi:class I lanthipeptide [Flavobacterium amniphilum]|uniref:class I lanthipeptide n=1 Tax=Flavobacterium amniphilum TaxID=1834035 RepID=UPI00202A4186|nr:class I lanthipeptide [Flavobacterium amniphilum]MCL9807393.1 class I lanthipeptide [Flavobacterium amniphilum]